VCLAESEVGPNCLKVGCRVRSGILLRPIFAMIQKMKAEKAPMLWQGNIDLDKTNCHSCQVRMQPSFVAPATPQLRRARDSVIRKPQPLVDETVGAHKISQHSTSKSTSCIHHIVLSDFNYLRALTMLSSISSAVVVAYVLLIWVCCLDTVGGKVRKCRRGRM
jgi:hypothetical protein